MTTLTIESLLVESFATTETAGELGQAPSLGEQALFAPMTYHTDPCDSPCQQN